MLTTIPIVGAVFALFAGASALVRFRRILGLDASLPSQPYAIVFGAHPVVPRLLEELTRAGVPDVLVAPTRPPGLGHGIEFVAGDPAEDNTVRRSQPARANRALIACTADADTLVVAVSLHHLAPDLEVYAMTQSARVARALGELGVTHTLANDELIGHTLAKSLETPEAGDLLLQLVDTDNYKLAGQPVDDAFVSRPLSQARGVAGALVLGIGRDGQVDLGVAEDPVLTAGDTLIVLAPAGSA
jgi:voltage-gated potassium channel